MIQTLAPKWAGSLPAMFDFARSTAAAPVGSSAHVALVQAHYEAAAEEGSAMYWRLPGVREDVLAAAARSIDSPSGGPSPASIADHNWFLYTYARLGEWERFRRELPIVGGRLTSPWPLLQDPVAAYFAFRQRAAARPL